MRKGRNSSGGTGTEKKSGAVGGRAGRVVEGQELRRSQEHV